MRKSAFQIYNLLKVLNKNIPLKGLNSISEVYENQADMIDEIVYFHKIKNRKNKKKDINQFFIDKDENYNIKEEEEEDEELFDHEQYRNQLKKSHFNL